MYKKYKNIDGSINENAIIRTTDNACIPFDLANTDYQEYLKWLKEGNTPLPAEEVGLQPTADEISE
jgi:hypothetical protein